MQVVKLVLCLVFSVLTVAYAVQFFRKVGQIPANPSFAVTHVLSLIIPGLVTAAIALAFYRSAAAQGFERASQVVPKKKKRTAGEGLPLSAKIAAWVGGGVLLLGVVVAVVIMAMRDESTSGARKNNVVTSSSRTSGGTVAAAPSTPAELADAIDEVALQLERLRDVAPARPVNPPQGGRPPVVDERPNPVAPQAIEENGWTVVFRGENPKAWNTNGIGDTYARPLDGLPEDIRYLRFRRMDTREALIVPITKARLTKGDPEEPAYYKWNGDNSFNWGGYHLGIAEGRLISGFDREFGPGLIAIQVKFVDYFIGSGFGHKAHARDEIQTYGWHGKEIGPTSFEVAVTSRRVEPTPPPERP